MNSLRVFTIYKKPRDYPTGWIVREWTTTNGRLVPGTATRHENLKAARNMVPPGMVCMRRSPEDDPAVYETWI